MLNSKSDIRSRSSSPIPPSLEKNDVVADIISPPTLARHQTVVEEDEHHTRLGEHAAVLWKFNKMTDITVKLNEEKYPAHKTVLSCYSRYFKEELLKSDKNVSVINLQLEGVTNEAFSVLLRYMYTADLELNCQNLGDVYTAARKLRMDEAIDACTKIVEGKDRHEVHSVYVFVTAKKLGLQEKASSALRSMCRRFEHIAGTQEFLDLTCEQVMEYLSQDELATRSEVVVYLSALKWLSVRYLDREQDCVRVVACVRFPMMNLNEVLACHTPPLLPGIVELPAIKNMLLTATCFIASKTINQEKLFQRYNCPERTYLLKRETISLWDPSIFDPDCHALYAKGVAASTIQARFRDYKTNKAKKQAAEVIQKAYRHLSHGHDPNHPYSSSEDDEFEKVSEDIDAGERNSSGIIAPLAEKIRSTVTGLFGSSSQPRESDEKEIERPNVSEKRKMPRPRGKPSSSEILAKPSTRRRKSNWEIPYEHTSIVVDLEEHDSNDKNDFKKVSSRPVIEEERSHQWKDSDKTSEDQNISKKHRNKEVEKSVAELAKSVYDKSEDTYGAIVISGGFDGDAEDSADSEKVLLSYKPATSEWHKLGEMYKPRHHHRLVYLTGFLYCIGGCNPERTRRKEKMVPLKSCYSFDLSTRTWAKIPDMRHCRVHHATAVLNGKIYVVGGKDEDDCMLSSVEVYDPESNSWTELYDPLDSPTIGTGVCSRDGKLWVIGGMSQDSKGKIAVLRSIKCYDPETHEWSSDVSPLPSPRAFVGAAVCGGRVYVVGGSSHAGPSLPTGEMSSSDDVFFYDDNTKEWAEGTPLKSPRHFVGAVVVYKSLFVLGGLTSFNNEALDEILIYNEENESWVLSSHIPVSLCGFAAVAVPKQSLGY